MKIPEPSVAIRCIVIAALLVPPLAAENTSSNQVNCPHRAVHSAWQVLTSAIQDHSAIHRQNAIGALSTLPPWSSTVRLLTNALKRDKDDRVRAAAAAALGTIKAEKAIPDLRAALDDEQVAVRFAAAQSLWKMGDHSGRDVLLNVLEGESSPGGGMNKMIRQQWDDATGKLHDPQALAWMGAEEASGAFLGPFAIGVTMAEQLTKDKGAPARVLSASMLASDHNPKTVRDLDESLGDNNWVVRVAAVKALGAHSCVRLIPDLTPFLDDKHDELRFAAATSILRIAAATRTNKFQHECELIHGGHSAPSQTPQLSAAESQSGPGKDQ